MSEHPLIVKFRERVLSRGFAGIKEIGRFFKLMDDNGGHSLSFDEFFKGLGDFNVGLTKSEANELFKLFDSNESGTIDFDELLVSLRVNFSSKKKFSYYM